MWLRFAYYPTLSEIRMYIFGENTAYWWRRETRWFCCLFHPIEHLFSDGNTRTRQYNCSNNSNVQINCQTVHSYITIGDIMISWYRTPLLAISENQSWQDIKQNIYWMTVAGQSSHWWSHWKVDSSLLSWILNTLNLVRYANICRFIPVHDHYINCLIHKYTDRSGTVLWSWEEKSILCIFQKPNVYNKMEIKEAFCIQDELLAASKAIVTLYENHLMSVHLWIFSNMKTPDILLKTNSLSLIIAACIIWSVPLYISLYIWKHDDTEMTIMWPEFGYQRTEK